MKRETFEAWEEKFIAFCEEKLEEEPIYPYEHLWKKSLSVQQAFEAYLQENPDYAEKFQELAEDTLTPAENAAFLEMARKVEAQRLQKELEEKLASKMSKFCPDCARVLGTKKQCKCGYRRK